MTVIMKDGMEDQRLFASAALFRQLNENKKDIYDVLGQFISSTIVTHQLWEFDVTMCSQKLNSDYGFDIPEAVVKSCLKNRLKKNKLLELKNGKYFVTKEFDRVNTLTESYNSIKNEQQYVIDLLIKFIKDTSGDSFSQDKIERIISDFYAHFIHPNQKNEHSLIISSFIVKYSEDPLVVTRLNKIEEGLLIYGGICYSSDLVNAEPWRNDFQIILDTELLFDATGLNGEIHQRMFTEFIELIRELRNRSGNKSKLELIYFEDTKNEIESYFFAAEKLFERKEHPDPSRIGMVNLLKTCSSTSDVLLRKVEFYSNINKMKISLENDTDVDYYDKPEYNIESISKLEEIKRKFPDYDQEKISDVLKIFTKINYKRKGKNNTNLEKCGAILVTGKNITKSLSYYLIPQGERFIPYAVALDYMTERLWFKSHKGFSNGAKLPTTFDAVAKAQVIISSQLTTHTDGLNTNIKHAVDSGIMSPETATNLIIEIRSRNLQPEELTPERMDDVIDFMNNDFIENSIRTRSLLENAAEKGKEAENNVKILTKKLEESELARSKIVYDNIMQKRKEKSHKIKKKTKILSYFFILLYSTALILIASICVSFIYTSSDTIIGITSLVVGALPLIFGATALKKIKKHIKKLAITFFKKNIKKRNLLHPINTSIIGD